MSTPAGSAAPLQGRVALVAGSSRGAGRGTAVALGEAGATVYCTGSHHRQRRSEYEWRDGAAVNPHFAAISESPLYVGRTVAALAADPDVHGLNGGSFSSGGLAREYGFTDVDGSQPDAWRYIVEVQEPGLPADPTGYL